MDQPQSRISRLSNDLRSRGFELSGAEDETLHVAGKALDDEQIELLAGIVAEHGARMMIDQRGVFGISFEPGGGMT